MRIDRAVREDQLERVGWASASWMRGQRLLDARREAEVVLLAHREGHADRVELRDRRQRLGAARPHEIAELRLRDADDAVEGRADLRETQIDLRRLDRSLRRLHRRLRAALVLNRVVVLLLADGALLDERRVADDVETLALEGGARAGELSLRLIERRLERARVDAKQQLALFDELAFLVVARDQIARHLRANGGIDESFGGAEPLGDDRDVALGDLDHEHFGRGRLAGIAGREQDK